MNLDRGKIHKSKNRLEQRKSIKKSKKIDQTFTKQSRELIGVKYLILIMEIIDGM